MVRRSRHQERAYPRHYQNIVNAKSLPQTNWAMDDRLVGGGNDVHDKVKEPFIK